MSVVKVALTTLTGLAAVIVMVCLPVTAQAYVAKVVPCPEAGGGDHVKVIGSGA